MFLWRTDENYPSIIIKYPPYLVFWQVILLVLSCGGSYHNMHLNVQNRAFRVGRFLGRNKRRKKQKYFIFGPVQF